MSTLGELVRRHPQITAWIALALGMVIMLLLAARRVGLLPSQMAALIVTTVVLAGLCVWIIGWNDLSKP